MATLAAVRTGMMNLLDDISGLNVYDTWPNTVNPPACIVRPTGGIPHTTFSGNGAFRFEVVIAVTLAGGPEQAQALIDPYLAYSGTPSLIAKLESDETLGGNAQYLLISGWRDYGVMDINGNTDYWGAVLDVEVHTTY